MTDRNDFAGRAAGGAAGNHTTEKTGAKRMKLVTQSVEEFKETKRNLLRNHFVC